MVKCEMCYKPLHDFFVPFFFIGIGLHIDPSLLGTSFGIGLVLLAAAILGKIIGTSLAGITQFVVWIILGGVLMTLVWIRHLIWINWMSRCRC